MLEDAEVQLQLSVILFRLNTIFLSDVKVFGIEESETVDALWKFSSSVFRSGRSNTRKQLNRSKLDYIVRHRPEMEPVPVWISDRPVRSDLTGLNRYRYRSSKIWTGSISDIGYPPQRESNTEISINYRQIQILYSENL